MDDALQPLSTAPILAFSKDLEGCYRTVTPRWLVVFGAALDEVIGRTDMELFPAEVAERAVANDRSTVAAGALLVADEAHIVDGVSRVMRVFRMPLVDDAGRPVGVSGYMQDVTAEIAALGALEDAQQRYEAALDRSPQVLVAIDLAAGAMVEANANAERFFGRSREEIFQLAPWHLSPPNQPDGRSSERAAQGYLDLAVRDGQCTFDWVHQHASGEPLPCRITLVAQRLGDRQLVQAGILDLGVASQRGHMAWERRTTKRLQELNRLAGWEIDAEGGLLWTSAADGLFPELGPPGTLEQALARFRPEARDRLRSHLGEARTQGRGFDVEVELDGARGAWVRLLGATEADGTGGFRVFGTAQDIEERRHLSEQLVQAQKLEGVGRLAGAIAHDFNNVLTVVLGAADLIEFEVRSDRGRANLATLRSAVDHAAGLTAHLLAFARRGPAHATRIAVDATLQQIASMLVRLLGEDLKLVLELGARDAAVRMDRVQLEQVLFNLTVNSRDAMPRGGRLALRTLRRRRVAGDGGLVELPPGPYVLIEVEDDGAGMSAAVRERVIEPFFTTKGVGEGTGLGLSTVHGIVRQAGGTLEIRSEEGLGTTVRVWLPEALAALASSPEAEASSAAPGRSSGRVLVVEDEPAVREVTRRVLERSGFEVVVAEDAHAALAVLAAGGVVDVMVSDVIMPDVNGLELREQALVLRPDLPVLFVSGYAEAALWARGLDVSQIPLLTKPFRANVLVERVRALVCPGG